MITDGDFIADRRPVNALFPGDIIFYRNRIQLILSVPLGTKGPDQQGWFDTPFNSHDMNILTELGIEQRTAVRVCPEGFVLRSDGIWDSPVR